MTAASRAAPAPSLHQRILDDIAGHILSGRWPVGHHIPSELELATRYGCARMTVSKAMTELVRRGLVERRRRAGSFVSRTRSRSAVLDIPDIRTEVESLGLVYRHEILQSRCRMLQRGEAGLLVPAAAGRVRALWVRHHAGSRPFCLEFRIISLESVPEAADERFEAVAPGAWLAQTVPWSGAEHRIQAAGADERIVRWLEVAPQSPCLLIERRTWRQDVAVTFARLVYPGDAHQLIARFSPDMTHRATGPASGHGIP